MKLPSRLLLTLMLLAAAMTLPAANKPAPNWYSVELIIFAYTDPQAGSLETWPANPGAPPWSSAQPLAPASSPPGTSFAELTPVYFRLDAAWQRLQRTAGYAPLLHLGWVQPAVERPVAQWVRIGAPPASSVPAATSAAAPAPTQNAPPVYGVAKLATTGPYLHFDLDLVYCGPPAAHLIAPAVPATAAGAPPPVPACQPYRLAQGRKIDAGRLNYFDHPLFGALLLVTPLSSP